MTAIFTYRSSEQLFNWETWNTLDPTASIIVFYLAKYALTNEQSLQDLTKQESKTGTISVQVGFCSPLLTIYFNLFFSAR